MVDQNLISKLERIITHEIRVYEGYNALTELEKKVIAPFNAEKVLDAASRREQFLEEMKRLNFERQEIISQLGFPVNSRLTEVLPKVTKGNDYKRLMQLAKKLKSAAQSSYSDTKELSGVVKFGTGMVNGLLSIFWSATQHVTKSYTRLGNITESATPAGTRDSSVLKKA
jgi:hypothetical protein